MRNPLTSIVLSTEILRFPGLSFEKQQQKIEQIAIACQQLQSLINSLLIMAKLESGKMVLNYTEVDLGGLCISALADVEAIAAQKNLTLISELPKPGDTVKVDAAIFRRVLDNLLSNAIKFSPSDSQVILRAENLAAGGAKIQVTDSGSGIPENLRQSIFEKYEIGTVNPQVSQIGLGLAFCKMAIDAHHGRITVEDNYPKGSTFTVVL